MFSSKTFSFVFISLLFILCIVKSANSGIADTTIASTNKPNVVTIDGVEQDPIIPSDNISIAGEQLPMFNLVQYRQNAVTNTTSQNLVFTTSQGQKTIPPNKTDSMIILDDKFVKLYYGGAETIIKVKENEKPKLSLMALYNLSASDIKLSKIQKFPGFRVIITDDYADQLEFKITGPVKYKVTKQTTEQIVIDVTLDVFKTESAFENYSKSVEKDRYNTGFNVLVTDRFAPHKVSRMGMFCFTEW